MYAIIEDGSHQFRVREGDHVRVDHREGKAGDEIVFSKVLLIAGGARMVRRSGCPRWKVSRSLERS